MRQREGERSNERHENMTEVDSKEACSFLSFFVIFGDLVI